jgi:hypothetical protein
MKRKFLRLVAILLGVAAIFLAYGLYGKLFDGDIRQYQVGPDGNNIAEWKVYHQSGATSTDLIAVKLRKRFNPFRHAVLFGLDYGADLSVTWIDARNLLVPCPKCGSFEVNCFACGSVLDVLSKGDQVARRVNSVCYSMI